MADGCSRRNHVVIIGGGVEQVRAYELARSRDLCIVGTDAQMGAPALKLADHVVQASTRDPQATVHALEKLGIPLHAVMTIANDVPQTVASVATAFELPGISSESARLVSDKLAMKERLSGAGVPVPCFHAIDSPSVLSKMMHTTQESLILKPLDGRGARGVIRLLPDINPEWAWNESLRYSSAGRLLVESYVTGTQISTESFLIAGEVHTAGVSLRNYELLDRFAPFMIENGGDMPAPLEADLRAAVDDLLARASAALGIRDGVVKGDLILTPSGPIVIELAARLSGGYFASHQIPAATGIDLVEAALRAALGERIDASDLEPQWERGSSIRFWFPSPGVASEIRGMDVLARSPGLVHWGVYVRPGDVIGAVTHHAERAGFVITEGVDREEATRRACQAIGCLRVVTAGSK